MLNELNSNVARFTTKEKILQPYLLQDRFNVGGKNAKHLYSTRFASMFENKLHVFLLLPILILL